MFGDSSKQFKRFPVAELVQAVAFIRLYYETLVRRTNVSAGKGNNCRLGILLKCVFRTLMSIQIQRNLFDLTYLSSENRDSTPKPEAAWKEIEEPFRRISNEAHPSPKFYKLSNLEVSCFSYVARIFHVIASLILQKFVSILCLKKDLKLKCFQFTIANCVVDNG